MKARTLIIAGLSVVLSSCVTLLDDAGRPGSFSPKPMFLNNLPQGDDNYSLGFRDGCYNFVGQSGFGLSRVYDRPISVDSGRLYDTFYQQGYRHGDRYCSVFVNRGIIL